MALPHNLLTATYYLLQLPLIAHLAFLEYTHLP